jgi:hypothetical protein
VELSRFYGSIEVREWHPKRRDCLVMLTPPADWTAGMWRVVTITVRGVTRSATAALERLAASALDRRIDAIQRTTETYIHIRRDRFIFPERPSEEASEDAVDLGAV